MVPAGLLAFLHLARHYPERLISTREAMGLPVSAQLRQSAAILVEKKRVQACGRVTSITVLGHENLSEQGKRNSTR